MPACPASAGRDRSMSTTRAPPPRRRFMRGPRPTRLCPQPGRKPAATRSTPLLHGFDPVDGPPVLRPPKREARIGLLAVDLPILRAKRIAAIGPRVRHVALNLDRLHPKIHGIASGVVERFAKSAELVAAEPGAHVTQEHQVLGLDRALELLEDGLDAARFVLAERREAARRGLGHLGLGEQVGRRPKAFGGFPERRTGVEGIPALLLLDGSREVRRVGTRARFSACMRARVRSASARSGAASRARASAASYRLDAST